MGLSGSLLVFLFDLICYFGVFLGCPGWCFGVFFGGPWALGFLVGSRGPGLRAAEQVARYFGHGWALGATTQPPFRKKVVITKVANSR